MNDVLVKVSTIIERAHLSIENGDVEGGVCTLKLLNEALKSHPSPAPASKKYFWQKAKDDEFSLLLTTKLSELM